MNLDNRTMPKGNHTRDVKVRAISVKEAEREIGAFGKSFKGSDYSDLPAVVKVNLPGSQYAQNKFASVVATADFDNGKPIADDLLYARKIPGAKKGEGPVVTHLYYRYSKPLIATFEELEFGDKHALHDLKHDRLPGGGMPR